jgi:hypothetical protein
MGVVSLAIGLWLYITFNEFAAFSDGGRLLGSVFLVATGFGVIIVGFLGIVAALCESRIIASVVRGLVDSIVSHCFCHDCYDNSTRALLRGQQLGLFKLHTGCILMSLDLKIYNEVFW